MNPYLTEKAEGSPFWHKPVFGLMVFLAGLLAVVDVDFIREGDFSTAVVGLGLIALCVWPVARIAARWIYGAQARELARVFERSPEETLTFKELDSRVQRPDAQRRVERLLEKRYLQNLHVDAQRRGVVLTAPNARVQKNEIVQMECPNCGAKNPVIRGRVGRCAYCESPLIYKREDRTQDQKPEQQKKQTKKGR